MRQLGSVNNTNRKKKVRMKTKKSICLQDHMMIHSLSTYIDKSGIAWEKEEVYRETQRLSGRVSIFNPKGGQDHMMTHSVFPHLDKAS